MKLLKRTENKEKEAGVGPYDKIYCTISDGTKSVKYWSSFPPFVPDYTVKAVTDVLYLRIKRTTYLRALKASSMSKKRSPGDLELERYLERVTEDDNDVDAMLMSSPKMSPEKGPGFLERASSFISGRITPTLSLRGGVDRLSGHAKSRHNSRFRHEKGVQLYCLSGDTL